MIHHIPHVLTQTQVQHFREEMAKIEWVNGKVTAGTLSATVKQNQQLPEDHPLTHHLSTIILESLGSTHYFYRPPFLLISFLRYSIAMKIMRLSVSCRQLYPPYPWDQ